jgi:PKD repeat protein
MKIQGNGAEEWNRTLGGRGTDRCTDMEPTRDGGWIITSRTTSAEIGGGPIALLKTTGAGVTEWWSSFGLPGEYSHPYAVKQTSDGGYAITGVTVSFGTNDTVERALWVIRTDPSGTEVWNHTFAVWNPSYGLSRMNYGHDIVETDDGGFVITGMVHWYPPDPRTYLVLIRTDSHGFVLWTKTPGGDDGSSLVTVADGGFLVTGTSNTRAYLLRTDPTGDRAWERSFGVSPNSNLLSLRITGDGGSITAGSYFQPDNNKDLFLVKVAPEETPVPPPVAGFSARPRSGRVPLDVQFTDTSLGSPTGWAWDFDDDSIPDSGEQNLVFSYGEVGRYAVNLTVTNSGGSNTLIREDYVTVLLPVPGYSAVPGDPDDDGLFEDLNGNSEIDYDDAVALFWNIDWIEEHEPWSCFDINQNGFLDYDDAVMLFWQV